jgi:hypothetical protein
MSQEKAQKIGNLVYKRKTSGLTSFEDDELLFFRDNINQQEHKNDTMLEIQRRQTDKTICEMSNSTKQIETYTNWTRFMAIATAVMAIATIILAIISYFK